MAGGKTSVRGRGGAFLQGFCGGLPRPWRRQLLRSSSASDLDSPQLTGTSLMRPSALASQLMKGDRVVGTLWSCLSHEVSPDSESGQLPFTL